MLIDDALKSSTNHTCHVLEQTTLAIKNTLPYTREDTKPSPTIKTQTALRRHVTQLTLLDSDNQPIDIALHNLASTHRTEHPSAHAFDNDAFTYWAASHNLGWHPQTPV